MPPNDSIFSPENQAKLASCTEFVDQLVAERESRWIEFRRDRHSHPEASGEEHQTSRIICERLREFGIPATIPDRGVGVVGDLLIGDVTAETPAIAIRADIDALRMPDNKTVEYASCHSGIAHACGHDVHTTIVLSVAEVLSDVKEHLGSEVSSRIRFIFQAAEETCDGANWMIEDGYLQNVKSILGIHVEPNLLANQIGIRYGVMTAQVDLLDISILGTGGHTARPHTTTDPIHAASLLVTNLYQLLPRSVDVRDASVFTIGEIHGGSAANVIPGQVKMSGTLRTIDTESRKQLLGKIQSVCEHLAQLTGNEICLNLLQPLGSVRNAHKETSAFESSARQVVGSDNVVIVDRPSMGGEDFAMYLDHCPGAQIRLGCAKSIPWPHLHSTVFDVDERVIAMGVRTVARAALLLSSGH